MSNRFSLVIHGGAGTILKREMTPDKETAYTTALQKALEAGYLVLSQGGSAVDAVEESVKELENHPLFNAGQGAVFTYDGKNELD
ncbi:MAG TPA: isoaspartyl peptidase/L-asparaginase, partial [Flavisolibacter sp.]|nr:isoaspartyl peptidase/L-asparaginase [Flavisolibacter sp.]